VSTNCGILRDASKRRAIILAILTTTIISFLFQSTFSQSTIYSAQTGNWNSVTTWIGGIIPGPADSVVIKSGHRVSLATTAGEIMASLVIEAGAVFDAQNKTMSVTGRLIVDGTYTSDMVAAKDAGGDD